MMKAVATSSHVGWHVKAHHCISFPFLSNIVGIKISFAPHIFLFLHFSTVLRLSIYIIDVQRFKRVFYVTLLWASDGGDDEKKTKEELL